MRAWRILRIVMIAWALLSIVAHIWSGEWLPAIFWLLVYLFILREPVEA